MLHIYIYNKTNMNDYIKIMRILERESVLKYKDIKYDIILASLSNHFLYRKFFRSTEINYLEMINLCNPTTRLSEVILMK